MQINMAEAQRCGLSDFYFPHISLNSIINWLFHGRETIDGVSKWSENRWGNVEVRDEGS